MADKGLLPLFPLQIVLLPNTVVPLHIFEPRYRRMIGDAVENQTDFGVVFAEGESVEPIGCSARVESVTKRYDDGRFDIECRGSRRFSTLSLDHSEDYLQGVVEYFEDDTPAQADEPKVRRLIEAADQVGELTKNQRTEPFEPNHPLLTFQIAGALPVEPKLKQKLLAMRSEIERVDILTGYLELILERLEQRKSAQRLAGTNGHAPH